MSETQKLARTLISLSQGKSDEEKEKLLKELLSILKQKEKLRLTKEILNELKKEEKKRELILILARQFDKETVEKIKERLKEIFGKEKKIKIKIDEDIIGGFLAKNQNYLIDASLKGILRKLLWRPTKF